LYLRKIIEKAIWATEEKAIIFLRSVTKRQVKPTKNIPSRLKKINQLVEFKLLKNTLNRIIPIPPNLRRIPAKIIDP